MNKYTVNKAKTEIKNSIKTYLKKDNKGNYIMKEVNRLPFFLQGPPGVGKTEMAAQIADELGIGFVSLSITHHTRNTVLGLPVIENINSTSAKKYTSYTMSEIVAMVEQKVSEGYSEGILLVDEFASMSESLVAPMLAFLQTKNIGNYKLPEGWVLVLCSNPSTYNKTARSFDMAVMDRVRVMDICFDTDEFIEYAKKMGFHESITEYLSMNKMDAQVLEIQENGEKDIVTPRGWENLSWCIKGYEDESLEITEELVKQFIKSSEIAKRFYMYYQSQKSDMDINGLEEVLDGKNMPNHILKIKEKPYKIKYQIMELLTKRIIDEASNFDSVDIDVIKKSNNARENSNVDNIVSLTMVQKISKYVSNACLFLDAIQKDNDLIPMFINKIHMSTGILKIMACCKNTTYLKYARQVMGMDTFLKQAASINGETA